MPPAINPKRITASEYDEIGARFKQLGRSDESVRQIASEFNRGISTIGHLRGKMGA